MINILSLDMTPSGLSYIERSGTKGERMVGASMMIVVSKHRTDVILQQRFKLVEPNICRALRNLLDSLSDTLDIHCIDSDTTCNINRRQVD